MGDWIGGWRCTDAGLYILSTIDRGQWRSDHIRFASVFVVSSGTRAGRSRAFIRNPKPDAERALAGATELEPAASCVTGRLSNQLNYARFETKSLRLPGIPKAACRFLKPPENAVTAPHFVVTN